MFRNCVMLATALLLGAGIGMQAPAATSTPTLATLQKQAATGKPAAEFALGQRLIDSKNPADKAAALKWIHKAAMQGDTDAAWSLGLAYSVGWGGTRDLPKALKWMRKGLANASGKEMALYAIVLAGYGKEVPSKKDDAAVAEWLRRSAEAGYPEGMNMLGVALTTSMMGVTRDPAAGEQWLLKAARLGNVQAQATLGKFYMFGLFGHPDVQAGMHWLRVAAQHGAVSAEGMLGYFLITGDKHAPQNSAEGLQWADKTIAKNNAVGYYDLGLAYQLGSGKPVDPAKAWYNFAVAQRLDTKHQLIKLSSHMSDVAAKLSAAQISQLKAEVSKIPVPTKEQPRFLMR